MASTGGWNVITGGSLSGAAIASIEPGATASFTFTGRAVAWVARTGPEEGIAEVRIDGALVQTIDLNAAERIDRAVVFSRSWAAVATHSMSIRVLATLGRPRVTLDAVAVLK